MTPIAPHITAYLTERLPLERAASDNTWCVLRICLQAVFRIRQ